MGHVSLNPPKIRNIGQGISDVIRDSLKIRSLVFKHGFRIFLRGLLDKKIEWILSRKKKNDSSNFLKEEY